jgi:hypothetical protein
MPKRRKNKLDHTGIGFLIGFVIPVFVFIVFYLLGNHQVSLVDFAKGLWQLNALIKLGSLCIFVNSIVFMIFIRLKYEKTARGILGATIMYAFVVLISKAI